MRSSLKGKRGIPRRWGFVQREEVYQGVARESSEGEECIIDERGVLRREKSLLGLKEESPEERRSCRELAFYGRILKRFSEKRWRVGRSRAGLAFSVPGLAQESFYIGW